jgi:hypothetical protein
MNMDEQQKQMSQILNKMIFDSINEILDSFRKGGLEGEPLPHRLLWESPEKTTEGQLKHAIASSKDRVLQLSTFMCGFIQNKEDSFLQLPVQLDEEIVCQIKEDRLFKLLQHDVCEYEAMQARIDEEEYEVRLEVSNMVFQDLFEDLAAFLESFCR